MKATDIRVMTKDQVQDEILKLKKEQFNLRFQKATGQVENTARTGGRKVHAPSPAAAASHRASG